MPQFFTAMIPYGVDNLPALKGLPLKGKCPILSPFAYSSTPIIYGKMEKTSARICPKIMLY